jgi:GNAT superfamily N-acetyltransferase
MTLADVDATSAAILADRWGDRAAWFRFAVEHPRCDVVLAEVDGAPVGTGVATHNGRAAWIGTIWVARAWRGQGLGRALTTATIDAAETGGATTLILVATDAGRPLYERLGFEVTSWYRTMEAPGRAGDAEDPATGSDGDRRVRAYAPADLEAMRDLDARATGEDRGHLLEAFATPTTTRIVVDASGRPGGFLVRPPWGGGATIAPVADDALALLDDRRARYPGDRMVRAGVLDTNVAGLERLVQAGWTEAWRAPRLQRGAPLRWTPNAVWGQFNHALG